MVKIIFNPTDFIQPEFQICFINVSIELPSFIFIIFQNSTVIFLKSIRRKETSIINQSITCKHKINESNAKVSMHYWIVWLHSKYVCFMFLCSINFSISLETCSTPKLPKQITLISLQNKAIPCIPVSAYSSRLITLALSFILFGKLSLGKTPLNLGSFWYFLTSKYVKGWGEN